MVAFSDSNDSIDGKLTPSPVYFYYQRSSIEFWRIRSLVSSTARGPRSRMFGPQKAPVESHEEPSVFFSEHRVAPSQLKLVTTGKHRLRCSPMPQTTALATWLWCFSTFFCWTLSLYFRLRILTVAQCLRLLSRLHQGT